jgi:hypothetical protein
MTDLALQVPAAVISQLLGISIDTANGWTQRANASNANYGADILRR